MMPSWRQKAFDVHGEQCVECGAVDDLEVHHIDGDRTNNRADNLRPLCVDCHSETHYSDDSIGVECVNCGYSWGYGGSRDPGEMVTCPRCYNKVRIPEGATADG